MSDQTHDPANPPVISHVEWHAPDLTLEGAHALIAETMTHLRHVPGLVNARFFGDFETGRHFFMLTWADMAALDAYLTSEEMFSIRKSAMAFLTGRVRRELFTDYSPDLGRPPGT
jgi:quinol monooxygenase YgiN